jgi:hypothetical protein
MLPFDDVERACRRHRHDVGTGRNLSLCDQMAGAGEATSKDLELDGAFPVKGLMNHCARTFFQHRYPEA